MTNRFNFRAWDGEQMVFFHLSVVGLVFSKSEHCLPFSTSSTVIMQSTGLRGEDEKEIFEGDIVTGYDGMAVVEWNGYQEGGGGLEPSFRNNNWDDSYERWSAKLRWHWFKIIGNIYEHPHIYKYAHVIGGR